MSASFNHGYAYTVVASATATRAIPLLEGRREPFNNDGLAFDWSHNIRNLTDAFIDIAGCAGSGVVHDVDHRTPASRNRLSNTATSFNAT